MPDAVAISTEHAPAAVGPYSQAIRCNGFLFCSGQIGLDPATGKLVEGGVEAQARRVLDNIAAVLAAEGLDYGDIVKTLVLLADIDDFATVNAIYGERMPKPFPARSAFAAGALPLGARVEIEVTARTRD